MYVQHESVDSPFQPRFVAQRESCSLGFGVSFCRLGTVLILRLWFLTAWEMVGVDSQPIELQSLFLKDCGPTALTQKHLTTLCPARVLQRLSQLREVGMDSRLMENLWPEQRSWVLRPGRG